MMVNNNRRTKLLPKIILGQLGFAALIVVVSLGIIFYAQGYRINFRNFHIIRTGVIFVDGLPKDSQVSFSHDLVESSMPTAVNVSPGFYNVKVNHDGYIAWEMRLQVQPESVNVFKYIVLFKSDITPQILTDDKKIAMLRNPSDLLASNDPDRLWFTDYEIWIGDRLVTRFSTKIQNVKWYSDMNHIVYQQGNQIRIIETFGTNDDLLVIMKQSDATLFALDNGGEDLYFADSGQYFSANIR